MVFSSKIFLFYFLPITLLLYLLVKRSRRLSNLFLTVMSLLFYAWGEPRFVLVMMASIVANWIFGLLVDRFRGRKASRAVVAVMVVFNLGLLGVFKYLMFVLNSVNSLFGAHIHVPQIALPIGISFFTFQAMSYVIDVYRGKGQVQKNLINVCLYISFFPQLIAGPIVRYQTIEEEITLRKETFEKFSNGLRRFILGLGKKILLANTLAVVSDYVFVELPVEEYTSTLCWLGAIAYTLQIYLDFSAYSDMAIGLGRMFGFHFLENFNYPYISDSITEFWRRWHISLSSWFRDYVYFPLGGSYCSTIKNVRNLAVVWFLTGLWHGAAWNYVFWGLWYLAFLLIEKFLLGNVLASMPSVFRHLYTLLVVIAGWVFFRSPTLGFAFRMLHSMAGFGSGGGLGEAVYYLLEYWPEWILCLLAIFPVKLLIEEALNFSVKRRRGPVTISNFLLIWGPKFFAILVMLLSYLKLVTGSFNPFIYFQF